MTIEQRLSKLEQTIQEIKEMVQYLHAHFSPRRLTREEVESVLGPPPWPRSAACPQMLTDFDETYFTEETNAAG